MSVQAVESALTDAIAEWMSAPGQEDYAHGNAQGIARALAALRSTTFSAEWEAGLDRYQNRMATMASLSQCAHCGNTNLGDLNARVNRHRLCHPNVGMDCYQLVTVHREPIGARLPGGELYGKPAPVPSDQLPTVFGEGIV